MGLVLKWTHQTYYHSKENMATKPSKTPTVATIDTKIAGLFAVLQSRQQEVALSESTIKAPWKTNCSWQEGTHKVNRNIQTMSVDECVEVGTQIITWQRDSAEAAAMLNVPAPTKINGSEPSAWFADLSKRITTFIIREQKKELEVLETRLSAIVSPEQRRQMELEAITKSLGI